MTQAKLVRVAFVRCSPQGKAYPARCDRDAIVEGDEVTTFYDPMIAKLIVWAKNREAALTQMHHALSQFHVDGLGNNIAFLDRLVRSESFKTANLDTNLIQREDAFLLQHNETASS